MRNFMICPPTNIKTVMKLRSRRRDKNVACFAAILFRNLETRCGRRRDSNAINFEEIIWGSVEWAYMVQTETRMGFSKQVMKVQVS
jgi:hypothetical protein